MSIDYQARGTGSKNKEQISTQGAQLDDNVSLNITGFNVNPKFKNFRKALSELEVDGGIIDLLFIGDSITEGQHAGDVWEDSWEQLRTAGFVARLRKYFSYLYEDMGEGIISISSAQHDNKWVFNGNWTLYPGTGFGIMEKVKTCHSIDATAELEFEGDGIEVYYIKTSGFGGFNYYINDVLKGTIAGAIGLNTVEKLTINGTSGTNVVKIKSIVGTSNNIFLMGARPLKGTNGIRINNVALGSQRTENVVGGENSLICTIDKWTPTVTFIAFLANDFGNQIPLATYEANLRTMVTRAKTFGDVVMSTIGMYGVRVETIPQSDYLTIYKTVATDLGAILIDVYDTYDNDTSVAIDLGFMMDDVHPNSYGHMDIYKTLLRNITA